MVIWLYGFEIIMVNSTKLKFTVVLLDYTAIQPYSHIAIQPYSHTAIQPYSHITILNKSLIMKFGTNL
jgi:hypothetical protein